MNVEQLQAIKGRLTNVPDGWTISQGNKLIEQLSFDGIALVAEAERQKANAEQYLKDNVNLHNEILVLNNEIQRLKNTLDRTELAEAKVRMENEQLQNDYQDLLLQFEASRYTNERYKQALENIIDICDKSEHIRTNYDLGLCEYIALTALEGDSDAI